MTTTLSSRGQVVLPRNVRAKLGLLPGTRFEVSTSGRKVGLVRPKLATFDTGIPGALHIA